MTDETPRCVVCRNPRAVCGVCAGCVTSVDRMLSELLDLHALANHPAALMPGSTGDHGPGGAHRDPPPPVNIDALDLAIGEHQLGVLEAWERWWREAFALTPYGPATEALPRPHRPSNATLMHVIGFLRTWWPRAAQVLEPPPDEFADEVRQLHRHALAALRLGDAPAWSVPCPADLGDRECGYRLTVEHDGRAAVLRCPRCRSAWTIDRLLLVAGAAGRGVWVDAQTAAQRLGVTTRTVHRMAQRGSLPRRYGRFNLTGGAA